MDEKQDKCAFICSRDTLEGAYPALVLGINARRLGLETKVFYTFMGLNVIRKGWIDKVKINPPGAMGAIPGMSSLATWMMKRKIEQASIPHLEDLQEMALLEGVEFIACQMTVDMMGLSQDDFIDGVVIQTAEEFMKYALDCKLSLFT
ncbi:MAG: DsrE/DsrF/DrsH-like family protein [Deltaproteobacteria bacterium]|nr:DsrE/DsrF/DrsH-like family protein [Deltaproteobacteria bacterium]